MSPPLARVMLDHMKGWLGCTIDENGTVTPPHWARVDLHALGLIYKDTMVDGERWVELVRGPLPTFLRTKRYRTTREAWEEMWLMLVRERGGV